MKIKTDNLITEIEAEIADHENPTITSIYGVQCHYTKSIVVSNLSGWTLFTNDRHGNRITIPDMSKSYEIMPEPRLGVKVDHTQLPRSGVYILERYELDDHVSQSLLFNQALKGAKRDTTEEPLPQPCFPRKPLNKAIQNPWRHMSRDPLKVSPDPEVAMNISYREDQLRMQMNLYEKLYFIPTYKLANAKTVWDRRSDYILSVHVESAALPDHPNSVSSDNDYYLNRHMGALGEQESHESIYYCPENPEDALHLFRRSGSGAVRITPQEPTENYEIGYLYMTWIEYDESEGGNMTKSTKLKLKDSTNPDHAIELRQKLRQLGIYDSYTLAATHDGKERLEANRTITDSKKTEYDIRKIMQQNEMLTKEREMAEKKLQDKELDMEDKKRARITSVVKDVVMVVSSIVTLGLAIVGLIKATPRAI